MVRQSLFFLSGIEGLRIDIGFSSEAKNTNAKFTLKALTGSDEPRGAR